MKKSLCFVLAVAILAMVKENSASCVCTSWSCSQIWSYNGGSFEANIGVGATNGFKGNSGGTYDAYHGNGGFENNLNVGVNTGYDNDVLEVNIGDSNDDFEGRHLRGGGNSFIGNYGSGSRNNDRNTLYRIGKGNDNINNVQYDQY